MAAQRSVDPRAERTLAALERALIELAAHLSPSDVTVAEVCRVAGLHRTTFYKHFDTVSALSCSLMNDLLTIVAAPIAVTSRGQGGYASWLTQLVDHVAQNRSLYGLFLGPTGDLAVTRTVCDSLIRRAEEIVATAHDQGIHTDLDSRTAARLLGFSSYGLIESVIVLDDLDVRVTVDAFVAGLPSMWRPVLAVAR